MKVKFQDLRQTEEWANYLQRIGWGVERLATNPVNPPAGGHGVNDQRLGQFLYIKKLPLLPLSVAKLQRPLGEVDFEAVFGICRKQRVIVLYFEPNVTKLRSYEVTKLERQLKKLGFRKTRDSYLPRRTIWVDLKKSEKQLLLEMKPKTRYNIGLAKRRRITIKLFNGQQLQQLRLIEPFLKLLRENAKRLGIFAIPRKWFEAQVRAFGDKCFVALAYSGNEMIAGNFFMASSNACFHSHNGSTMLGRKLMAPSLCVWEGIREAKRRKLKTFDFDGIYDDSSVLKRWQGFSRFKKGFGGKETEFVGQWVKWMWPF